MGRALAHRPRRHREDWPLRRDELVARLDRHVGAGGVQPGHLLLGGLARGDPGGSRGCREPRGGGDRRRARAQHRMSAPLPSADVTSREAPLEYWFIKLHAGELAFLVDFIIRRQVGAAEVRVSVWVRRKGRVVRFPAAMWSANRAEVAIADNLLTEQASRGHVDDVEWDLRYDPGSARVAPAVPLLSAFHPFDLELISRPRVVFDGYVSVAGERFNVAEVEGLLTHYWGRRLPDSWRWLSAGGFGGTDLAVESVLMRSRLWGR